MTDTVWILDGISHGNRPAPADAVQHEPLQAKFSCYCLEVQQPLLHREFVHVPIGESCPARIVLDDSPVLGELIEELASLAPLELAVHKRQARHAHDQRRPLAGPPERDANAIAGGGVLHAELHAASISYPGGRAASGVSVVDYDLVSATTTPAAASLRPATRTLARTRRPASRSPPRSRTSRTPV